MALAFIKDKISVSSGDSQIEKEASRRAVAVLPSFANRSHLYASWMGMRWCLREKAAMWSQTHQPNVVPESSVGKIKISSYNYMKIFSH